MAKDDDKDIPNVPNNYGISDDYNSSNHDQSSNNQIMDIHNLVDNAENNWETLEMEWRPVASRTIRNWNE